MSGLLEVNKSGQARTKNRESERLFPLLDKFQDKGRAAGPLLPSVDTLQSPAPMPTAKITEARYLRFRLATKTKRVVWNTGTLLL